jgi:secreted trypsin-like serine protease
MKFSPNRQWIVAGITSFGYGCAIPGYAGIYTRVAFYSDWIRNIAGINDWVNYHDLIVVEEMDRNTFRGKSKINTCSRHSQVSSLFIMISIYLSVHLMWDNL